MPSFSHTFPLIDWLFIRADTLCPNRTSKLLCLAKALVAGIWSSSLVRGVTRSWCVYAKNTSLVVSHHPWALCFYIPRLQIIELGQTLLNLANLVPNGFVVFLPSYAFLSLVKLSWGKGESKVLDRLGKKKKVWSVEYTIWGYLTRYDFADLLRAARKCRRGARTEGVFFGSRMSYRGEIHVR
jgi:hypothetical protein